MERRDAIKALAALPMLTIHRGGKDDVRTFEINPKSKYIVLVNPDSIDVEAFGSTPGPLPEGTPVFVVRDSDMDNALRIFKIEE